MKRILFLFLICLLATLKSYSQAAFTTDTVIWSHAPNKINHFADGWLYFSNSGTASYSGYAWVNMKSNFNSKTVKLDSVLFTTKYGSHWPYNPLQPKDTTFIYFAMYVDTNYFKPNVTNIVVVWPTGAGIATKDTFFYSFTPVLTTSIQPVDNSPTHLRFYPNPSPGIVHYEQPSNGTILRKLSIYNMAGKEQNGFSFGAGQLDMQTMPVGNYILRATLSDGTTEEYRIVRSMGIK